MPELTWSYINAATQLRKALGWSLDWSRVGGESVASQGHA